YHRRGIGRFLKQWVIGQCPALGITTLLSMHFDHNEATPRINESLGFERQGHLTEIATVQGQKRGVVIWALRIPPGIAAPGADSRLPAPGGAGCGAPRGCPTLAVGIPRKKKSQKVAATPRVPSAIK